MNTMILLVSFLVGSVVMAAPHNTCIEVAKKAALGQASKEFKVSEKNLSAQYVTGESLDSDTNSDGSLYVSPSVEVFAIANKINGRSLVTYSVSLETITDNKSGELVECAVGDIQKYEE